MTRIQVRRGAAVAAGVMAAIYYLIGMGILDIGGSSTGQAIDLVAFGTVAGTTFLGLALLFLFTDRRRLWMLALVFQVWVYVVYVAMAAGREPPFEIWGILLRLVQVPVALALIYLAFVRPAAEASPHGGRLA